METCECQDESEGEEIGIGGQEVNVQGQVFLEVIAHGIAQQLIHVAAVTAGNTARTSRYQPQCYYYQLLFFYSDTIT